MGWIIVAGMLALAALMYIAVQVVVLLARGLLLVGTAALRLFGSLLR